jgi:hypothetical protein
MISALLLIQETDMPIIVLRRKLKGKSPKAGFVEFRAAATSPYPAPGIITGSQKASTNTSKPDILPLFALHSLGICLKQIPDLFVLVLSDYLPNVMSLESGLTSALQPNRKLQ